MKLYHFPLSGHAHRARLFLSLIGAAVEVEDVDLGAGAHKQADFLALNRFGQVPVLVDGDAVIADSNAILVYIAKTFGRSDWLPEGPATAAEVQRWLSVAAGQIAYGPAAARLITVFGAGFRCRRGDRPCPCGAGCDRGRACRPHLDRLHRPADNRRCCALQLYRCRAGRERRPFRLPAGAWLAGPDRGAARLHSLPQDPGRARQGGLIPLVGAAASLPSSRTPPRRLFSRVLP
jgi:Glutathione S-transferase